MSTTADTDQLPADARGFRLRRYYLVVGIVGAVLWAAAAGGMGGMGTLLIRWEEQGAKP